MSTQRTITRIAISLALLSIAAGAQSRYLGFDRNDYPGDAMLPALRRTFAYTGYWLNNPPGETRNTWSGKRTLLRQQGFGFLVLFDGRTDAQLHGRNAAALGWQDGAMAVAAARSESFPAGVRIFLDQEEGGRLLPEQAAYLFSWIDAVEASRDRAGVYCSGIPVNEGRGTISTAEDIAQRLASSRRRVRTPVALWIANDACPPAPGCTIQPPPLRALHFSFHSAVLSAWQYAQSPRRSQFSAACPRNQAPDGNCYAPGVPPGPDTFIDLDVAQSSDPSEAP